jgi:hypothetical protein
MALTLQGEKAMRIKNLFTGVITNERSDIAKALIRQGMAEAVTEPKKQADLTPKFSVGETSAGYVCIRFERLSHVMLFTGHPDFVHPKFFLGCMPPGEIIEQYRKAYSVVSKRDPSTQKRPDQQITSFFAENSEKRRALDEATRKEQAKARDFRLPSADEIGKLSSAAPPPTPAPRPSGSSAVLSGQELEDELTRLAGGQ